MCLYNLPRLLAGTVQFDSLEVHYSAQRYLSDELRAGRVPFWTPFVFSGFPFLADLQVGAWYPLNWPFFLAGIVPGSINGELLVHTLIACAGAYALVLRLIGRAWPAVGAAMFYGLSGWFAAHSQHVGMVDAAAWLPLLLLVLHSLSQRVTLARLAVAGLVGAAIMLPGSFQIALYTFSFSAVWAALEAVSRRSRSTAARFGAGIAAAALWGGLLAAVMILPALELVSQSIRTQLNAGDVDVGYFHPAALLTFVDPDFYGLLSGHYSGPGDSTQHYFYGGIVLLPLAVLGARDWQVLRTAVYLGVPFLWFAAGPAGGLFLLVARLPGFRSVELPMHGWFLPCLGLALLGGAGLKRVEAHFGSLVIVALLAFVLVDVTAFNQLANPLAYARGSFDALYGPALTNFQSQLAALQPTRVWGPPLASIAYRNHALQSRVETTYGYNPLELTSYAKYVAASEGNPRLVGGFAATHALQDGGLVPVVEPLPLAYFARSVTSQASLGLDALDAQETTLVAQTPPAGLAFDPTSSVTVTDRGESDLVLRYASDTSNVVRIAIPMYPGWRATMNGQELALVTVDQAFIGVVVPSGQGEVMLTFASRWFSPGLAVSAVALLGIATALGRAAARNASAQRRAPAARP